MEEMFFTLCTHPVQQTFSFVSWARTGPHAHFWSSPGDVGEVTLWPITPPLKFGLELASPVVLGQVGKEGAWAKLVLC